MKPVTNSLAGPYIGSHKLNRSSGDEANGNRRKLLGGRWHLQLLGGMSARNGDIEIAFPGGGVTLLMARLALSPRSAHSREELIEMLAKEHGSPTPTVQTEALTAKAAARNRKRLSAALNTLRTLLATPGEAKPLRCDRYTVQLNEDLFDTDVACFDDCIARGDAVGARAWYRGELLPGLHQDWIDSARDDLSERYDQIDAWSSANANGMFDVPAHRGPELSEAPPRRSALPRTHRGFFGRSDDLARLKMELRVARLVTVTGPPGCGKSRLAEAAAQQVSEFHEVVVAPLAHENDAASIADVLRAAILSPACDTPAIEQLAEYLADRRTLLVLDNFEHLVGAAGDAALDELMQALPRSSFLLTSRRALQRADEVELALGPLPLPRADADVEAAFDNPAVAIFVDRARRVRTGFHLQRRNVRGIVKICLALEGMPFAIALAAAQVNTRSPDDIADGLENRLGTLARRHTPASRSGRHDSIEVTLAASWRLLDGKQRAALRALTAFRGGWTEAQARGVVGGDARALLDALVRDSLVQPPPAAKGHARWDLLVIVREYVREHTTAAEAAQLRQSHRQHFLDVAVDLAGRHARAVDADVSNFVAAMETALDDKDVATAVGIAINLESHWSASGAVEPTLRVLQRVARASAGAEPRERVALHGLLADLLILMGRGSEALAAARGALAAAGNEAGARARALLVHTQTHWRCDHAGARAVPPAREALRLAQQIGHKALQARALLLLGALTLTHLKDPGAASRQFEEAERLFVAVGDHRASVLALPGRTVCLMEQKLYDQAIAVACAGAAHTLEVGDIQTHLLLLCRLSECWERQRQFEKVVDVCQRQAHLSHAHGLTYHLGYGVWNQCRALARLRRPQVAIRLMAFVCALWPQAVGPLDADDAKYVRRVRRLAEVQLGERETEALWNEGGVMPHLQGVALAGGSDVGEDVVKQPPYLRGVRQNAAFAP